MILTIITCTISYEVYQQDYKFTKRKNNYIKVFTIYLLSVFIDLTQVHNFTVSAQDIFTARRLSVFTVSITGILQLLMQNNETFCTVLLTSQVVMIQSLQPKGREFESTCVCVFFLPLFDSFNFIYNRCITTSEE